MRPFLLLLSLFAILGAAEPVRVSVHTDRVLRPLDPAWFGSGTEYYCPSLGAALGSTAAKAAVQSIGMGFLRWPHGTSALWYFWDAPQESYRQEWMSRTPFQTADDLMGYCRQLGTEPLVQVNTYQVRRAGKGFEDAKMVVGPGTIDQAAAYAARWVADAKARNLGIRWWEIGNEDWVYWTGRQHAAFAASFSKAMRAADPQAKLLAQGFVGSWKGAFLHSDGAPWTAELAEALPEAAVDGISVHLYLSGRLPDRPRPLAEETAALFARVDRCDGIRGLRPELIRRGRAAWQIWVTEYNLMQSDPKGPGGLAWWQNLAHGLVLADWSGRLLELGVDRLAVHDLVGHPAFELLDIAHRGSLANPRPTVPALALQAFTGGFAGDMLVVETSGNPARLAGTFVDPELAKAVLTHQYQAVSAYAARTGSRLRVVLVNRDCSAAVPAAIDLGGAKPKAGATIARRCLGEGLDLASDNFQPKAMEWQASTAAAGDLAALTLPAHSITTLDIALE